MACTTTLPVVLFNDACQTVELGQVFKIFMTRATSADVLADVTDLEKPELRHSDTLLCLSAKHHPAVRVKETLQ